MEEQKRPEILLATILEALSVGPCVGTDIRSIVEFFNRYLILDENEAATVGEDMTQAVRAALQMGKQLGLIMERNGKVRLAMNSYRGPILN